MHLAERDFVLARLVDTLKPGGLIMDEEYDALSLPTAPDISPGKRLLKTAVGMNRVFTQRGADLRFGRLLFDRLRSIGLTDVGAEARAFMLQGGSVGASLLGANFNRLREAMIEADHITTDEFERDIARLDDPAFQTPSPLLWAAWGRRTEI